MVRRDRRSVSRFPDQGSLLSLMEDLPAPVAPTQTAFTFEHVIRVISERMDEHAQRLDRIHSGQLTLCAQVKDLRESLPVQRRPLSQWAQQIHVEVTHSRRNGLCPCCQEAPVCDERGRLRGAEFDHWYARNRSRAEETWLVCGGCNQRLVNTDFKAAARSAFESYQLALRRVVQTRQASFPEGAGAVAS